MVWRIKHIDLSGVGDHLPLEMRLLIHFHFLLIVVMELQR